MTHCCVGEVSVSLEVAQGAVLKATHNRNDFCSSLSSSGWLQMLLLFVYALYDIHEPENNNGRYCKSSGRNEKAEFQESVCGIEETALTLVRLYGVLHLFSEAPPF